MKKLLITSLVLLTITTGAQGSERRVARQKMGCWALCMLALAHMTGAAPDEGSICENQRIALPGDEWGGPNGMRIGICTDRDYDKLYWGCEDGCRSWVCKGGYRVAQHVGSPDFWLSEDVSTTRCVQKEKECPLSSDAARLKTGTYTNIYDEREYKLLGVARDHTSCKEYALYEGEGGSFREDEGLYAMPLKVFTNSVTLRSGLLSIEKPLFKYKEQE